MEPRDARPSDNESSNLDYWMSRTLREWDRACDDFSPESIHDLRVALRRCRSIADGFMVFDPHPAWKLMKSEGRQLFRQLGGLRDTQVMMAWIERIAPVPDEASATMSRYLAEQETQHKESAAEALQDFGRKKWASWSRMLSNRAQRIPAGGMAFRHLALQRWTEAHALHRLAMRNRSHTAYHRLRIALKKFRYTVENFMPELYAQWGAELGEYQDILGEMHDLNVLWQTALNTGAFPNEDVRIKWRLRISDEIHQRLERYRHTMLGNRSRWHTWRADLPEPERLGMAVLARLRAWAGFRDPDFAHSAHVARLSLQIYDGLESLELIRDAPLANGRFLLEAAALTHDAGMYGGYKKHPLASYRMIRKMNPSPGLDAGSLQSIALIARFHQGALPHPDQKAFSGIPDGNVEAILQLCGILRLADAFDRRRKGRIRHLTLTRGAETLHIHAPGYEEGTKSAEKLSAARHLLEKSCALPIVVCPL